MINASGTVSAGQPGLSKAWYFVLLLSLLSIVSYADRLILGILVDPIKSELGVNDTQMGFLLGLSFSFVYATLALVLAKVADSHNRRNLIIAGVLIWSIMTSASAFADGFWQLAVCRLGVGIGEAALGPAALSIISDLFSKERRHTPLSVFLSAGVIGGAGAYIIGGGAVLFVSQMADVSLPIVGQLSPWRMVFLCMGLPGILLGILMWITVSEPTRRNDDDEATEIEASTADVVAHLKARAGEYLPVFGGILLVQMMVYAVASWYASVLIRIYDLSISSAGFSFGIVGLIFGTSGAIFGPFIVGVLERKGRKDALLLSGLLIVAVAAPATIWAPIAPTVQLSLMALAVVMFSLSAASALAPLLPQLIAPNAMRARVTALYFFIANLIGLGLTPVIIGFINDAGLFGVSGIHEAISFAAGILLPASVVILYFGRKRFVRRQGAANLED